MKECCMSCKFVKYEKDKLYPVICRKGKPSQTEQHAYENICNDYMSPNGRKRTTLLDDEIQFLKELMKGGHA